MLGALRIWDVSEIDVIATNEGADAATVLTCCERGAEVLFT